MAGSFVRISAGAEASPQRERRLLDVFRDRSGTDLVVDRPRFLSLSLGTEGVCTPEEPLADGKPSGLGNGSKGLFQSRCRLERTDPTQRSGGSAATTASGSLRSLTRAGTAFGSRRTPMLPITPASRCPFTLVSASRRATSTEGSGYRLQTVPGHMRKLFVAQQFSQRSHGLVGTDPAQLAASVGLGLARRVGLQDGNQLCLLVLG